MTTAGHALAAGCIVFQSRLTDPRSVLFALTPSHPVGVFFDSNILPRYHRFSVWLAVEVDVVLAIDIVMWHVILLSVDMVPIPYGHGAIKLPRYKLDRNN